MESKLSVSWMYKADGIDWDELAALYREAPLGIKSSRNLETAFANSMFRCFLFDQGKLIAVGRALADGIDCSNICDVAVLPSYQGLGLGKEIVAKLVSLSSGHKKIILYSYPGKEEFYKKLGFKRMSTAMALFENQAQAIEWGFVNET